MIGKHTKNNLFKNLTTNEQREYLISISRDMTNEQAKELLIEVNKLRAQEINLYLSQHDFERISLDHLF